MLIESIIFIKINNIIIIIIIMKSTKVQTLGAPTRMLKAYSHSTRGGSSIIIIYEKCRNMGFNLGVVMLKLK